MRGNPSEDSRDYPGILSQSISGGASVNGTGIPKGTFDEALVICNVGAIGTNGTCNVKAQESDDNSTWSDIAGAAFGQFKEAATQKMNDVFSGRINLSGRKHFIRISATQGTAAVPIGVVVRLCAAKYLPVTPKNTLEFDV